jgi:hypothetical protein
MTYQIQIRTNPHWHTGCIYPTQLEGDTMKRFSMTITAAAIMAATAFLSAPAQAGGIKLSFGHNNHRNVGHSTIHTNKHVGFVQKHRVINNHAICRGYYADQAYQYWVQGYYDQYWVDTSRWTVNGLNANGQANHVWVSDGYYESYWVNGYWATGYNRVWIGDGCHRCR